MIMGRHIAYSETVTWSHGSVGRPCVSDGPTPLSKMGKRRDRCLIVNGKNKGKVGIYANCPLCRVRWVLIGLEGGGE